MAKKGSAKAKQANTLPKPADGEHDQRPERWGDQPQEHDYPAAGDFLGLIAGAADVKRLVSVLKAAPLERHKAKDLLRASGLELLPVDNAHVAADLAKVKKGERLSPVLLVRGDLRHGVPLTIADGYHRVCASYHLDENADIPCHLADLATGTTRTRPSARTRSSRGPTSVQ
jgi:hypothetical protein